MIYYINAFEFNPFNELFFFFFFYCTKLHDIKLNVLPLLRTARFILPFTTVYLDTFQPLRSYQYQGEYPLWKDLAGKLTSIVLLYEEEIIAQRVSECVCMCELTLVCVCLQACRWCSNTLHTAYCPPRSLCGFQSSRSRVIQTICSQSHPCFSYPFLSLFLFLFFIPVYRFCARFSEDVL